MECCCPHNGLLTLSSFAMAPQQVMEQASQQKEFKEFLVGLALGWIMEKGGGGLEATKWTESKLRGNYKGKVPVMQTVRAEALIEEVEEEVTADPAE